VIVIATSSPNKWMIGAELIKLYQKTTFSHCLIIKDGIVYESSHGDTHSKSFEEWRKINHLINIYLVDDSIVDMDYVLSMVKADTKYGVGQIIRIAIKYFFGLTIKRNNGNSRLICSEFVGRALRLPWVDDYTSPKEMDTYLRGLKK
jgi:hypothetical protein